jgi:hypothetical protein
MTFLFMVASLIRWVLKFSSFLPGTSLLPVHLIILKKQNANKKNRHARATGLMGYPSAPTSTYPVGYKNKTEELRITRPWALTK